MKKRLKDQKWYPYTVALCVAVLFYVILTRIGTVYGAVKSFTGHFTTVLIGGVIAYLMNPLATLYERTVCKRIKKEKLRWILSVVLCLITLLLFLGFLLGTLVPQLVESLKMLVTNMDSYVASLESWTERMGLASILKIDELIGTSGSVLSTVGDYLMDNITRIVDYSAAAGKGVAQWVVALILSVYVLMSKHSLKRGAQLLLKAAIPAERYEKINTFLSHCNGILVHYISYTLLDALIFIIFTVILQFLDAYFIKPKLFGESLGVSGLLILVAVVVCGSMFGVVGILLAIPLAAILQFVYVRELLPLIQQQAAKKQDPPTEKTE